MESAGEIYAVTELPYNFFLDLILTSRIEMRCESATDVDNFVNSHLVYALLSRAHREVGPVNFRDIDQIVGLRCGPLERFVRLLNKADCGLVFFGLFTDDPRPGEYRHVGTAFNSAASIAGVIGDEDYEELYGELGDNVGRYVDLLHHIKEYHAPNLVGRNRLLVHPGIRTVEGALNLFYDCWNALKKEESPEKRENLLENMRKAMEVVQRLKPSLALPNPEQLGL